MAQLDSYKGLIFATFDPAAPPLLDYLGPMTWYLDTLFDRREGGSEIVGGVHKWVVPCNWKMPAENFAGDAYHVQWSHLSPIRAGFSVGVTAQPKMKGGAGGHGQRAQHDCRGRGPVGRADADTQGLRGRHPRRAGIPPRPPRRDAEPGGGHRVPQLLAIAGQFPCLPRLAPQGAGQGGNLVVGLRRRGRATRGEGGRPQERHLGVSAPRAPSSRTIWTTGRNAPRPAGASWPAA